MARSGTMTTAAPQNAKSGAPYGWDPDCCAQQYVRDCLHANSRARTLIDALEAKVGVIYQRGRTELLSTHLPRPIFVAPQSATESVVEGLDSAEDSVLPPKVAKLREEIIRFGEAIPQYVRMAVCVPLRPKQSRY